ncbi:MAG: BtpA/SgcQ family protein [Candidatus Melainabacteria bacterium]|nr:BtpA/SgcQ family protein [Candidatus Melainabacteria bacterium]
MKGLFGKPLCLIGAVHLLPLPGAADYGSSMDEIVDAAVADALIYKQQGFDALVVENTHDAPYLKGHVAPETVAAMTVAARRLKEAVDLPLGVQLLAGANIEALAVAVACDLDFIRVEGFVFAHVGDEGIHEACAAELIRRRFNLRAGRVKIFADIKKKHSSHAITADVDIAETAIEAANFKADGVVVTGARTGLAPLGHEVEAVRKSVDIPLLIGSGIDEDNIRDFAPLADALIIGSAAKSDGRWTSRVCPERAGRLVKASRSLKTV